uniref:DNA-J related domain-containing protein n=1 Tax=Pseudoalteromonas sp. TaxID=53249 RepID=UPI003D2A8DBD
MQESSLYVLETILHGILKEYPEGLNEYAVFDALKAQRDSGFDDQIFESELSLFQNHFLLFHCLYRLRDRLLSCGEHDIEIHCLNIKLID